MSHRRSMEATMASISFVNSAEINTNTNPEEEEKEEGDIVDIEPEYGKAVVSIYAREARTLP
ncbi:hypothetical protein EAG_15724 [Camponotus floridanus]|uniref:Uncharacterized protein n=1 Tax=Camponotus floridanus TaxID=104421 RepID=E2AXB5_CAMFO|nr:hypothetical protein EAG_15724 [Camponotus floridanus]